MTLILLQQFGENSTTLNRLLVLLRERVTGLKDTNKNASKSVMKAKMHAGLLSNQAAILDSLIRDTRNYSDSAVRAATVYSNIVQAILEALAAANEASTTALSAKQKVFVCDVYPRSQFELLYLQLISDVFIKKLLCAALIENIWLEMRRLSKGSNVRNIWYSEIMMLIFCVLKNQDEITLIWLHYDTGCSQSEV